MAAVTDEEAMAEVDMDEEVSDINDHNFFSILFDVLGIIKMNFGDCVHL